MSKLFYRKGLLHHRYKFGLWKNIKVWFCRTFGHEVSSDPSLNCCNRCGLCYEEIYHNIGQGWYYESGIISDVEKKYVKRIEIINKVIENNKKHG